MKKTNKIIKKKKNIPIKIIKTNPILKSKSAVYKSEIFENLSHTFQWGIQPHRKDLKIFDNPTAEQRGIRKVWDKFEISEQLKYKKAREIGQRQNFSQKINELKNKVGNLPESQRRRILWLSVGLTSFLLFIIWAINFTGFSLKGKKDLQKQNDFYQIKNELQSSYQNFKNLLTNFPQKENQGSTQQKQNEEKILNISQKMIKKLEREN